MISIIWYMSLQVKQYCIAIPNFSSNAKLVTVTEAICQVVNCSAIRPGGKCYLPDVPYTHACWAMNLLYRHNGACDLEISQLITHDPCQYSTRIIYINSFFEYICIWSLVLALKQCTNLIACFWLMIFAAYLNCHYPWRRKYAHHGHLARVPFLTFEGIISTRNNPFILDHILYYSTWIHF